MTIVELLQWCIDKGLNPTSVRVGDTEVQLMPRVGSGAVMPAQRGPSSLYDVYASELMDEAFTQAHGNLPTTSGDELVPVVTR